MRLCTWPLQAPHVLPSPSWLRARAVALSARTASPLLPSAPRPPNGAGESLGGARSGGWPHPPGRLFLGLLRAAGRWLLLLASWGALSSSPAPALLQPSSSPAPAQLRPSSGPTPALLQLSCTTPLSELRAWTPGWQLSAPRRPAPPRPRSLPNPCARSSTPTTPPQPSALSLALSICPSVCLSASPPSFSFLCPALLACSLVRLGGAASQENPRNLCKKLTMKFKKFYDFGAIFEWSESFSSLKLNIGEVWLEGAEDVYIRTTLSRSDQTPLCVLLSATIDFFSPLFSVHVKMTCNIPKTRWNLDTASNLKSGAIIINGFI